MQSEKIFLYRKCQVDNNVIWKNHPQWVGMFVETLFQGTFWNWAAVPKDSKELSFLYFWFTASVQFCKSIANDLPSVREWVTSHWKLTSKEPQMLHQVTFGLVDSPHSMSLATYDARCNGLWVTACLGNVKVIVQWLSVCFPLHHPTAMKKLDVQKRNRLFCFMPTPTTTSHFPN